MSSSLPMSSADAAWLRMDGPASPMVINALIRFEEPLDARKLADVLERRLVGVYPKFAMQVGGTRLPFVGSLPRIGALPAVGPSWTADPRFTIERHLHRMALPRPGADRELRELVSDLVSTPLPADRPPWQVSLIEGRRGTAVLVRMHHCIADGIALAQVLLSLTDDADEQHARPLRIAHEARQVRATGAASAAPASGDGLAHQVSALAHQGAEVALHPRRLARLAQTSVREVETFAKLLLLPSESAGTSLSGARRVGWSPPIDLDLVKAVAHHNRATVNDVLLAAVAGAMRSLHGGRADMPRMTAIVPFNLRPADEPPPPELGNRFGLVFLELPVAERARKRRLALVKSRMDAVKDSPEGPLTYQVLQVMGSAPAAVEERMVALFSAKGTAVITNVPGPSRPRLFAGATVKSLAIWAPASGSVGMSVSLFSYRGEVSVGLLADTAVLADPQAMAERVAQEIEAMAPAHRSAA
jgi:diacylglycerol O-acyltransferase